MVITQPVIIGSALGLLLLCMLAEWLHARRTARIARLAFGPSSRPPAWTVIVPPLRCIGAALSLWGVLTLLSNDGAPADFGKGKAPDRHLVIALDVSPSMFLADAGPQSKQPRRERAADVMQSLLDRLDLSRTRVSIVAFYTGAKPVVVDTVDLNVVRNIVRDLPLSQAFKAGETDMYSGVKEAIKLAEKWKPGSTTLVVVSDGDTLPDTGIPALPPSIGDSLVIGVGNPFRPSEVGGHFSRQDASSLKQLSARLRGSYHDGNTKHLPSDILRSLSMLTLREDTKPPLRSIALAATATGATMLAIVSPLLAAFGTPVRRRVAGVARAGSSASPAPSALPARPVPVVTKKNELVSV